MTVVLWRRIGNKWYKELLIMLGVPMRLPTGLIDRENVVDAGTVGSDGLSWLCCERERSVLSLAILYCSNSLSGRNDHTTMTAPLPVCSAKLSIVGPG